MAAPVEKQATDIATATALQNFMSELQTRKLIGPAEKSTDNSNRAKPKPASNVLLPSEHQRQAMRAAIVVPVLDECSDGI
jgi:hypothetical protein